MKTIRCVLLAVGLTVIYSSPSRVLAIEGKSQANIWPSLAAKGRDAFPELLRFLETKEYDSEDFAHAMDRIVKIDGCDMLYEGDAKMLAMTRTFLPVLLKRGRQYDTVAAHRGLVYLCQKGDVRDLPIMKQYLDEPIAQTNSGVATYIVGMPYRVLQVRVAGTNVMIGLFDKNLYPKLFPSSRDTYTTNVLAFIPSVANTGPQAAYVYEAMMQEIQSHNYRCSMPGFPYCVVSNMPPEILTMRVWFDKDGKAVTDVDLSKYGISVHGLGYATNVLPFPAVVPAANAPATAKPPDNTLHQTRVTVMLAVGAGVLAVLLLVAGRKRGQGRKRGHNSTLDK